MAFDVRSFFRSLLGRQGSDKRRPDPLPFIREVVGDDLARTGPWQHTDLDLKGLQGDYYEIWKNIENGHKVDSYFEIYEKVFSPYRGRKLTVLEIGVYHGASVKAWRQYFGPKATIVGIDINPACMKADAPKDGIHVRLGSQSDPSFLAAVLSEFGPFDLIMDDGSHMTSHQLTTFRELFDKGLKHGGIYFIEDTHTSFWKEYCDGPHDAYDLAMACALGINYIHWTYGYTDFLRDRQPRSYEVLRLNKMIDEVRIFDSAIAICKARSNFNPPLIIHN